jgi:hypothetical protein
LTTRGDAGAGIAKAAAWWFPSVSVRRVTMLRLIAYSFILVDVVALTRWVGRDVDTPGMYQPRHVAGLLHLPTPTVALVGGLRVAVLLAAGVALATSCSTRRLLSGLAGVASFATYFWWMLVAMSYGKVDHDRFAFLVLLAVLPTVATAALSNQTPSTSAGWAVRTTSVAAVATYFLAGWAKIRIGGWGWVNSGTLAWAIVRRPSTIGTALLSFPWLLHVFQWLTVLGELASPLIFVIRSQSRRLVIVAAFYAFHVITFGVLGLLFLPHLVALAALLPLENLPGRRRALGRTSHPEGCNIPVSCNIARPSSAVAPRLQSAGKWRQRSRITSQQESDCGTAGISGVVQDKAPN